VTHALDNRERRLPLTAHMKPILIAVAIVVTGCQPVSTVGTQKNPVAPDAAQMQPGLVACGSSDCDVAQGETCCLKVSTGTPSCGTSACPQFSTTIACDGPEDCGGTACCGSVAEGTACIASAACASGIAQFCHADSDCPASLPTCCSIGYGTWSVRACTGAPRGGCS
jgi:hypothetical protein